MRMKHVKDIGAISSCEIKLQPFTLSRLAEHCSNTAHWAVYICYLVWKRSNLTNIIWQHSSIRYLCSGVSGLSQECCRTASTTWFFHYLIRLKHLFKNVLQSPLVVPGDWSFLNGRVSVILLQKRFFLLKMATIARCQHLIYKEMKTLGDIQGIHLLEIKYQHAVRQGMRSLEKKQEKCSWF